MRKFKEIILNQLDKLGNENPKAYWKLLKKIKQGQRKA
jgi:hypothetical protein